MDGWTGGGDGVGGEGGDGVGGEGGDGSLVHPSSRIDGMGAMAT